VNDLRPTSPKQLQSSKGTLIIEYTPSIARPMKEIELVLVYCVIYENKFNALF
jgi:2-C-methyl-D-erythritol 4-phosphate cytidylyltransferase